MVPYKSMQVDLGYTKQKKTYVTLSHTLVCLIMHQRNKLLQINQSINQDLRVGAT